MLEAFQRIAYGVPFFPVIGSARYVSPAGNCVPYAFSRWFDRENIFPGGKIFPAFFPAGKNSVDAVPRKTYLLNFTDAISDAYVQQIQMPETLITTHE